jgi:hypothetical protein
MTHQQWSYQNATVHLKIKRRTRIEHNQLLEEIDQCLDSDPGVLLQDHRQLMFADLGCYQRNIKACHFQTRIYGYCLQS